MRTFTMTFREKKIYFLYEAVREKIRTDSFFFYKIELHLHISLILQNFECLMRLIIWGELTWEPAWFDKRAELF